MSRIVARSAVEAAIKGSNILLFDVRQPEEFRAPRIIPRSINIPLPNFETAFSLEPARFEKLYGISKPSKATPIILLCEHGIRAARAGSFLESLGFRDISIYRGSCAEYFGE